ncbi:hypothetical protein FACS1894105_08160 [Clostridia bacterium]|nr:hypothetical protein FACS1894105_08160 [Clostridia bacterium]
MNKRIFCLVTAITLVVTSLFSCSANNDGEQNSTSGYDATTGTLTETTASKVLPDLPASDFEGYRFKVLTKGPEFNEWANMDIYAESQNADTINDAVYSRNRYVENKYNFQVTEVPSSGDMTVSVRKSVSSGDEAYDAIVPNMLTQATLAVAGCLVDLNEVPKLDLTKMWWDQRANADLSIGKKLYFTVSDLIIMDNDATWLVIFNKKLIEDFTLEDPYELVRSGNWTFDKLNDMSKGISKDLNGDGQMTSEDLFGSVQQGENMTAFYLASGEHFVTKDTQDFPVATMDSERSISVIDKICDMMFDNQISFNYWDLTVPDNIVTQKMFENNQAVFKITALQLVIRMREMETSFGIIPMPKYDSAQQEYGHYVHPTASAISIPTSNNNLERTGIILEALTAESRYTLRPAYYEKAISNKYLRDDESIEMLDIIIASRAFDLSTMFGWNGLGSVLEDMYRSKRRDFTSAYERQSDAYKTAIDKTISTLTALES